MTTAEPILEDTQTKEGGGSNATSEAPSGERAKRDNPRVQCASTVTVKDRGSDADDWTSVATLDPATQTVEPSAAPAHFCADCDCEIDPGEELCVICCFARDDEHPDGQWCFSTEAGCWIYE